MRAVVDGPGQKTPSLYLFLFPAALSSHPPHLFGSPYSICMFAGAVISSPDPFLDVSCFLAQALTMGAVAGAFPRVLSVPCPV